MFKSSLSLVLLSCGTIVQASQANANSEQTLLAPESTAQPPKAKANQCAPKYRSMRVAARHIEAGGIGYNKGYSTLEGFFAGDPNEWWMMPFLDLRGHVFNDGRMAANAGFGGRVISGCRAYGFNFYYDYRNTRRRAYNQVGMGLETLGQVYDFRVNGYLPVGHKISHPYHVEFAGFSGNSILVNRRFQFAMKGFDAEAGFHRKKSHFDFYGAAGPYYFKGEKGDGAFGGKVRLAASYKEYLTLEVSDSFDNVFHNNAQGQLTLTFPFGSKSKPKMTRKKCSDTCAFATVMTERMLQPVNRQEIVVVDTHTSRDKTSNFVIFVNNQSSSDGTFESPYPTLLEAQNNSGPGDIIYVFPGDGTTKGMDEGIILQKNQKFWGSSVSHTITTNLGTITIPPYTSNAPTMTNMSGNGINLASNNEVSGFIIANTSSEGIDGSSMNPGNVSILSTKIVSPGGNGINLNMIGNTTNTVLIDSVAIVSGASEGLVIYSFDASNTNVAVQNCTFNRNTYPFDFEIFDSNTAVLNVTFNNSLAENNSQAGFLYVNSTSPTASHFSFNNSMISGPVSSNDGTAIVGFFQDNAPKVVFSADTLTITNITAHSQEGIALIARNNAQLNVNINNCLFSGNSNPIDIESNNNAVLNVALSNNNITGNIASVFLQSDSDATEPSVFLVDHNTITGTSGDNSLNAVFLSTSPVQCTITNNTFTNNFAAVLVDCRTTAATDTLLVQNNQFIGTTNAYGLTIGKAVGASLLTATVENNLFQNNFTNAADIFQNHNPSTLCLTFSGNSASGTGNQYNFINSAGTFQVAPCDVSSVNVGTINYSPGIGSFSFVESCPSGSACP